LEVLVAEAMVNQRLTAALAVLALQTRVVEAGRVGAAAAALAALVLSSSLIQTFTLHQQLLQDRQQ
jgi:hypothetical protein